VKTFHDAEAVVMEHLSGKGKHKGKLGALVVQMDDGTEFSVGTGFSDAERASPPPVGSVISFRYQELSDAGVPRFPSFVRVRQLASETTRKEPKAAQSTRRTKAKKGSPPQKEGARYFEFVGGKSSKFWEVRVDECQVTVRYGRIGSDGTIKVKEFDDAQAAQAHAEKLLTEKAAKGYVERGE
jgi:DNA ligase-1